MPATDRATPRPDSQSVQDQRRAMLVKMQADRSHLNAIRSHARRNQRKGELLPEYADYLSVALNRRDTRTDPVLVQCCIWALDSGAYGLCLQLAGHAIQHGMESPDGFTRTLPEILLEDLA